MSTSSKNVTVINGKRDVVMARSIHQLAAQGGSSGGPRLERVSAEGRRQWQERGTELRQYRDQRSRQARIAIPENADMPRALPAVHHGREAVHRDERRHDTGAPAAVDHLRNRLMIGAKNVLTRQFRSAWVSPRLPGTVTPSLSWAIDVGSPSRRLQSMTSRE